MLSLLKKKFIKIRYYPFIAAKGPIDTLEVKRYFLWFCHRVFINVMRKGDDALHDHPWNYVSIILWGGYKETTIDKDTGKLITKRYGPGSIISRHHTAFHKLEILKSKSISLFFVSKIKVKKDWCQSWVVNDKILNSLDYQLHLCKTPKQKRELIKIYRDARDDVMEGERV